MTGAIGLFAILLALPPAAPDPADAALEHSHRVRLESPEVGPAARAAEGIGRILLRRGRAAEAAAWLQASIDEDPARSAEAISVRELAVRLVLAQAGARDFWRAESVRPFVALERGATGVVLRGDGTIVVNPAAGELLLIAPGGEIIERQALPGVELAAIDPGGRIWAVTRDGVVRLEGGSPRAVLDGEALGSPTALAVDAAGRLYVADRRGDRLQVVEPGETAARTLRERKGARITALAWDGAAVVALEAGTKRLVRIDPSGAETVLVEGLAGSPSHAAANESGLVAVVDPKGGRVVLYSAAGEALARLDARGSRVALGADGALTLLDERDLRITRIP